MELIPKDILEKIAAQFPEESEREETVQIIRKLWTRPLNVGPAQLARSILVLSEGDLEDLKKIALDFYGDPRDVIMAAEQKAGNPKHYFIPPFDEIDNS